MIARSCSVRAISWDAAISTFVGRFRELIDRHGPDSVAFLSTGQIPTEEMAFLGALVVSDDGVTVSGIMSERDIVRGLAEVGHQVEGQPVAALMTADVVTCTPADTTEQLMALVTARRIRHVPVVDADRLVGLVSIGDIVAARVHELEEETQLLRDYITAR